MNRLTRIAATAATGLALFAGGMVYGQSHQGQAQPALARGLFADYCKYHTDLRQMTDGSGSYTVLTAVMANRRYSDGRWDYLSDYAAQQAVVYDCEYGY